MDLFEAIKNRRSIRSFKKQDVPEDLVTKLLEAAQAAPTAGNSQPYQLVVARNESVKQQLAKAAHNQKSMQEAPVIIVVCADEKASAKAYGDRGKKLYCLQDTAIVTQNILLAAYALGLGTCWVGAFDEDDAKKAVHTPKDVRPVAMIPVGYPNEAPKPTIRRPISEFVHKDSF